MFLISFMSILYCTCSSRTHFLFSFFITCLCLYHLLLYFLINFTKLQILFISYLTYASHTDASLFICYYLYFTMSKTTPVYYTTLVYYCHVLLLKVQMCTFSLCNHHSRFLKDQFFPIFLFSFS